MSNRKDDERRIRVRSVRRDPPDLRKLSRALIELALAQAQAEADAQTEHTDARKREGDEEDAPRAA